MTPRARLLLSPNHGATGRLRRGLLTEVHLVLGDDHREV